MDLIGGFFGNESAFGRLMTKLGTIFAVNILFVITCIPFFTIGAATAALYHTIFEMLNTETPINPFLAYWYGLKKHVLPATVSWLSFVGVAALGVVNLQICAQAGGWIQYLSVGVTAVLIAAVIVILYLFPVFAVFSGKLFWSIKLSVCIAMSHPLKLILVLILHAVPLAVVYMDEVNRPTYAFVGAFFGFGLFAYMIGKLFLSQLQPYYDIMRVGEENRKSFGRTLRG